MELWTRNNTDAPSFLSEKQQVCNSLEQSPAKEDKCAGSYDCVETGSASGRWPRLCRWACRGEKTQISPLVRHTGTHKSTFLGVDTLKFSVHCLLVDCITVWHRVFQALNAKSKRLPCSRVHSICLGPRHANKVDDKNDNHHNNKSNRKRLIIIIIIIIIIMAIDFPVLYSDRDPSGDRASNSGSMGGPSLGWKVLQECWVAYRHPTGNVYMYIYTYKYTYIYDLYNYIYSTYTILYHLHAVYMMYMFHLGLGVTWLDATKQTFYQNCSKSPLNTEQQPRILTALDSRLDLSQFKCLSIKQPTRTPQATTTPLVGSVVFLLSWFSSGDVLPAALVIQ